MTEVDPEFMKKLRDIYEQIIAACIDEMKSNMHYAEQIKELTIENPEETRKLDDETIFTDMIAELLEEVADDDLEEISNFLGVPPEGARMAILEMIMATHRTGANLTGVPVWEE
jgi:hypothetical protein